MNKGRTIRKQELKTLEACKEGFERYIKQTNNSEEAVTVSSLVGGENTTGDFIWLAGNLYPRKKLVQFAVNCAQLVSHLNPDSTIQLAIESTKAWIEAPTKENEKEAKAASKGAAALVNNKTSYEASAAAYAASRAAATIHHSTAYSAQLAANGAAKFTHLASSSHSEDFRREIEGKINELLKDLFKE